MDQVERIKQGINKRYEWETWLAGQLLDLGHKYGVTERVLDIHEVEQFLNEFTFVFVVDPEIEKVFEHISNTLATKDLLEVFDIVHSLWMEDLVTAEHSWIDGNRRGCVCEWSTPEGSISDAGSEEEDLDDVASEVDVADIMPDSEFEAHLVHLPRYAGHCKIMQSIEALLFALDELIEPRTFRERARLLRYYTEEDDDSETVSEMAE